jgi:hypothetical protein
VAREPETAAQGYALALDAGARPEACARWLGELEEPLGERALPVSLTRAEALIQAGRPEDAVGVLQAAVSRTPRSVEARRALGELLLATGAARFGARSVPGGAAPSRRPAPRLPLRQLPRTLPHLRLPLPRLRRVGRTVAGTRHDHRGI